MPAAATATTVTEEELRKSIAELEGPKAAGEQPKPKTPAPKGPRTAATIVQTGSEPMRKALDVSGVLQEVVGGIASHNDRVLDALQKRADDQSELIGRLVGVVGDLKKSVDGLTAKVEEYGKQPTSPATQRPVTTTKADTLEKSATGGAAEPDKRTLAMRTKRETLAGLELLVKSASVAGNRNDLERWTKASIKFESTNDISDVDLHAAHKAYKSATTA